MAKSMKKLIRSFFNSMGYDVIHYQNPTPTPQNEFAWDPRPRQTMAEAYWQIKGLGFEPATIIDIGVANGTPELYEPFPGAYLALVEPLVEFKSALEGILNGRHGEYLSAAAGSKDGEIEFHVHMDHLDGSSIYFEETGPATDGISRVVRLIRVDDWVLARGFSAPFLIKIDVQGAELDVLAGCQHILNETEVITLEVSLFKMMNNAPEFYDVVHFMKGLGFVVYDLVPGWARPLDRALGQVDMMFVREHGRFRQNHAFATQEQMKTMFGNN